MSDGFCTGQELVRSASARIARHAIMSSGAVILPGVTVGEGAVAQARRIARRSRKLLEAEKALREQSDLAGGPC